MVMVPFFGGLSLNVTRPEALVFAVARPDAGARDLHGDAGNGIERGRGGDGERRGAAADERAERAEPERAGDPELLHGAVVADVVVGVDGRDAPVELPAVHVVAVDEQRRVVRRLGRHVLDEAVEVGPGGDLHAVLLRAQAGVPPRARRGSRSRRTRRRRARESCGRTPSACEYGPWTGGPLLVGKLARTCRWKIPMPGHLRRREGMGRDVGDRLLVAVGLLDVQVVGDRAGNGRPGERREERAARRVARIRRWEREASSGTFRSPTT